MYTLLQSPAPPELLDTFTSLGTAGVMAAMWLWERRTSRQREQQLDEAHARIMSDRVSLQELITLVRDNTRALARLCGEPANDAADAGKGEP